VPYTFNPVNKCVFLFAIKGNITVIGTPARQRDALGIWEVADLAIYCDTDAEFVLIETPVNPK
jgi:hypothetical protein